ncbi:MAG TPA: hypothetical protein EYQ44_08565 [Porticoccaceae bacterium]|nr:hypothetical protein [Porticoccaceae bacterium]HIK80219.1 hypothetical protein [Porticoccaceae bacterium]
MSGYWEPEIDRCVKRLAWIVSIFIWFIVGAIVWFEDEIRTLQEDDPLKLLMYFGGAVVLMAISSYINGGAIRRNHISPFLVRPLLLKQPIVWLTLIGTAITTVFVNTQ